jgi:peptidoglycan/LPS O-acetylase OafA/YrhL
MPAAETDARSQSALRKFLSLDLLDNRVPSLHGLRVFAILTVIQFHVTWIFAGEQGIRLDTNWVRSSLTVFFGMDLFFMLSGFLIGSILLRSLEVDGRQRVGRFYMRRVFRTFPSYYIVLTLLVLVTHLTKMQKHNLIYEYTYGTTLISLARPDCVMFWGWSLALEEQFYLTVPIFMFVLSRLRTDRTRIIVLACVWSTALVGRLLVCYRHPSWTDFMLYDRLYFRTPTRFDPLVAGILLAFVLKRYGEAIKIWLVHPFHRALLALPTLGCLWILLTPWLFGDDNVKWVHMFAWGSITSVMYFGLLVLMLSTSGRIQDYLSKPIFRKIATLGYGVYLVHIPLCDHVIVPLAQALDAHHVSLVLVWPLSLFLLSLLSVAVAYVMHVLIEKPSLWVRDRVAG